jgi:hypothetical protein
MRRALLLSLAAVGALSWLPASQADDSAPVALPPVRHCTQAHPCIHVFRVGPSTSGTSHVVWNSRPRFTRPNLAISVSFTPRLTFDQDLRTAPMADCGVHFWLNGRFNGVATRCGDGRLPLHVQIANVHNRPLRLVLRYWTSRAVLPPSASASARAR